MKEIEELKNWIVENYEELPKSKIDDKELVIFATGDFLGEYGYGSSDLESWGFDKEGKLFWAYASGCSCNCGADTEEKDIKIFNVENYNDKTDVVAAIKLFNSSKEEFKKSISSYEYSSY